MIWWWIGNAVLAFIVIPTVALIALRVVRPLLEIRAYTEDIVEHGARAGQELEAFTRLARTRELMAAGHRAGARMAQAAEAQR